ADGGTPNVTTVNQNTQLQFKINASGTTVPNPMSIAGAGPDLFGAIVNNVARTVNFSGDILLTNSTTIGDIGGARMVFTGTISDSSPFDLTKVGSGTIYLNPLASPSAANNFHGGN